jgi:hypothetical protein
MANVKILFDADASNVENYLKNKREIEGPTTENSCKLDGLTQGFAGIQAIHNSKGNKAIHIIQSWSPTESKQLTKEQVHEMGIKLAEKFAPGHQYVIQTHTKEAHSHNHILLNPVSIETGKRIQNKKNHLGTLRNLNDDIAREHGLSVLPQQINQEKKAGFSDKVKRIDHYRGQSYIVDLSNKATFSRHYATNYDEYLAILNSFDIQARIEPKNITYYYPGHKHGKRGDKLAQTLDKPELERKFQLNLEKYNQSPELKRNLSELNQEFQTLTKQGINNTESRKSSSLLVSTRAEGITKPRSYELAKSIIPIEEIQKAKAQSILKYCEKEGIKISTDKEGKNFLAGRDFVEVSDYTWINHKNRTQGNIIDFVANHEEIGFLHAIAKINHNPKLLLLEKYIGESKKTYQSFYIPKEDSAPRNKALQNLSELVGHPTSHPVYSELFKQQRVHVSNSGAIKFLLSKERNGYVEYTKKPSGQYQRSKSGYASSLFVEPAKKSTEIKLFLEPKQLLKQVPQAITKKSQLSVAALFEPNVEIIHQMVARQPHLKKLSVISNTSDRSCPEILIFMQELKNSLDPFAIETELLWEPIQTKELSTSKNMDQGRSLDL